MARHIKILLPIVICSILLGYIICVDAQTEPTRKTLPLKLPTFSIIEKSESIALEMGKLEWTVKYSPIFQSSEQITDSQGIVLVNGKDYQMDYTTGKVTFDDSVAAQKGTTWTITYRAIPFALQKIYRRDLFGIPPDDMSEATRDVSTDVESKPTVTPRADAQTPPSQLEYSGSRTFGIAVGSGRSLSQNQEFRINVRGNVSDNIEVLAMLSDQDLPIQPEGMTEDIQDINQKLIRIMHPNVIGTLGDFNASLGPSEFIFFPRALEGVKVEGNFEWGQFHLIPSALPKGQSTSNVIRGEEGRSEYRLDVSNQFVIVKAGSEIVWLNGEKMRRGENNDYIIREYGDPIIEFNSKHLITSNDVIRVDFEYIPEDRAYQQNLYGINNVITLPGQWLSFGASYAVEADLDDPEQALILLNEDELAALRQHKLDPEGDGTLLVPPQKHTVWGLESRLNLAEQTWLNGEFAVSAVDNNTYSSVDRKSVSNAWKLIGSTSWDIPTWTNKLRPKLIGNLDVRVMDAKFLPVGASRSNRNRDRYVTQYATEGFEDAILFEPTSISQASDEQSFNLGTKLLPYQWLQFNMGAGRTNESGLEGPTTRRNNINWGANFTPRTSGGAFVAASHQAENLYTSSSQYQRDSARRPSALESDLAPKSPTGKMSFLKWLPNVRWNDYRSTSYIEQTQETEDSAEDFQKTRQEGSLSYLLSPFEVIGTYNRFLSTDDFSAFRNRRRNRTSGRVNLVDFKWVSINTSYELEQSFAKEPLLALDGEHIGISDWLRSTTARTWKVGLFSQQGKWVNLRTNLARRMVKAHSDLGSDTTTQLADTTLQFTPFNRAIDAEVTYELDKKLTTQRREIYTDIHPLTGHRIQPGEGFYVRLDDLRYVEDPEEGTYIKIYQNVGDKPTTAVDASFRLRFQPRQFFARQSRNFGRGPSSINQSENPESNKPFTRFLKAINVQTRLWLTEEQEAEDEISLYLLQSLQGSETLFGRVNQHHRIEFSPSPLLSIEGNLRTGRSLNRRINTQERHRKHRTLAISFSVNPTQRFSIGANWEERRETERYSQLDFSHVGGVSNPDEIGGITNPDGFEMNGLSDSDLMTSIPISDLRQFEQVTELKLQYEISRTLRWSGTGGYKRTTDIEQLDDEPDAKTRTFSFDNRIVYGIFGKGRIEVTHTLGYGKNDGGVPYAQYYFYEGISHEVRATADYKLRKFTDLLFRLNYRLLSTKQRKPEHRLEMTVSAEL